MKRAIELFVNWTRFQKNRNLLFQISFLSVVFLLVFYLASKALQLELSLAHFDSRAGFGISHTFLVDYSSNDSRWDAYFTGVVNTIRVCLVGIIFTTILGTIMGVARLSKNFLISKISMVICRNITEHTSVGTNYFLANNFLKTPTNF